MEYELLKFSMICDVALVVDSSCSEPRTAHDPTATGDQEQFQAVSGALVVHVALDESDEPMRTNPLNLEILAHTVVPHVPSVHRTLISNAYVCILPKILATGILTLLMLHLLVQCRTPLRI